MKGTKSAALPMARGDVLTMLLGGVMYRGVARKDGSIILRPDRSLDLSTAK